MRTANSNKRLRGLGGLALVSLACVSSLECVDAAPPDLGNLVTILDGVPEGSWVKVNLNNFSDVWTPANLRPLKGLSNPTPQSIIGAWSSYAWDPNRGDLWIFGGGHANYNGNDVYRWRATTQRWERASLPSEITQDDLSNTIAIDGPDNAPTSSHTYDNNIFLPKIDRFVTFGGATSGKGGPFMKQINATTQRRTGPYFFNPNLADGNKVGGTTGSNVKRVLPADIDGARMWENRDIWGNIPGAPSLPVSFINGCTGYDGSGLKDVAYVAGRSGGTALALYKYTVNDLSSPSADTWEKVGTYWSGPTDQVSCAFHGDLNILFRTGVNTTPFWFWNLATASPSNRDFTVNPTDPTGEFPTLLATSTFRIRQCGMDADPARNQFSLWCGDGRVWMIKAPTTISTTGWTIHKQVSPIGAFPNGSQGTGILGKWKYIENLDVFMGLQDSTLGNIWLYKPIGWNRPNGTTNEPPSASISEPGNGATFPAGTPIPISVDAEDGDGAVVRVEFYDGATKIGEDFSGPPFTYNWNTASFGAHTLVAVATDTGGSRTTSNPVSINVELGSSGTITLQDGVNGYNLTRDTYLSSYHANSVFGSAIAMHDQYAYYTDLVRFGIFASEGGPVPNNAVVLSATLSLYKSTSYDMRYRLHAMLKPWDEASANWSRPTTGALWGSLGARMAGVDYSSNSDAVANVGFEPGWLTFDVSEAVRRFQSSGGNLGWQLIADAGYTAGFKKFHTREMSTTPAFRPKLEITFTTQ